MNFKLTDCAPKEGAVDASLDDPDGPVPPKAQKRAAAEVIAEFHYCNFMFCRQRGFSAEKTSTLLSMMKVLHSKAVVEGRLSEAQARLLLEQLLARHSRQLPPYSV